MTDLLIRPDKAWVVPASKGEQPVVFDMRKIYEAEGRLHELRILTKVKAPELLVLYIDAFGEAREHAAVLHGHLMSAKQHLKEIRSLIVLDKAPEALKTKGLASSRSPAGSEDLRESIVNTDIEFQTYCERLTAISVAADRMLGKVEKLKMAYFYISGFVKDRDPASNSIGVGTGNDEPGAVSQEDRLAHLTSSRDDSGFGGANF